MHIDIVLKQVLKMQWFYFFHANFSSFCFLLSFIHQDITKNKPYCTAYKQASTFITYFWLSNFKRTCCLRCTCKNYLPASCLWTMEYCCFVESTCVRFCITGSIAGLYFFSWEELGLGACFTFLAIFEDRTRKLGKRTVSVVVEEIHCSEMYIFEYHRMRPKDRQRKS